MDELRAERDEVLRALALALLGLVGRQVSASVQAPDGSTVMLLCGVFERAFELPWRHEEGLVVAVAGGSVPIRADEVDELDRWSVQASGERYQSVCVYLRNGTSVLIQEEIEPGSAE